MKPFTILSDNRQVVVIHASKQSKNKNDCSTAEKNHNSSPDSSSQIKIRLPFYSRSSGSLEIIKISISNQLLPPKVHFEDYFWPKTVSKLITIVSIIWPIHHQSNEDLRRCDSNWSGLTQKQKRRRCPKRLLNSFQI